MKTLQNASVPLCFLWKRVERLRRHLKVDAVLVRALAPFPRLWRWTAPLVSASGGGWLFYWKGRDEISVARRKGFRIFHARELWQALTSRLNYPRKNREVFLHPAWEGKVLMVRFVEPHEPI